MSGMDEMDGRSGGGKRSGPNREGEALAPGYGGTGATTHIAND